MKSFSIEEINASLKGILVGTTAQTITSPEQLELASNNQITFIGNRKYIKYWETSKACAAIINEDFDIEPGENRALIKVKNADTANPFAANAEPALKPNHPNQSKPVPIST